MDLLNEIERNMEDEPSVEVVATKVKEIMNTTGKGFDHIGAEIKKAFPYLDISWWEENWDELVSLIS